MKKRSQQKEIQSKDNQKIANGVSYKGKVQKENPNKINFRNFF